MAEHAAAASRVRRIGPADTHVVVELVHELAAYEGAAAQCALTVEQLDAALFAPTPALFGHVAELEHPGERSAGREVVGFALWFLNFSTWDGVHGIYLEDLYVRPSRRGTGTGRALLAELAAVCVHHGYSRLQWWVLDWNQPALTFYRSIGAEPMDEGTVQRLHGEALTALAKTR